MHRMTWKMIATASIAAALLAGCGGPITYNIKGPAKAPEADVEIVADVKGDAAMTTLKIKVDHLAPPDRLGSGKVFVVWIKGDKGKWQRVGALKYKEGDRKANLEGASVPATAFDMQVTVEKDADAESPSGDPIFAQHVN